MLLSQPVIEKIPFLHRNTIYNIISKDDVTFDALHHILDDLLQRNTFDISEMDADLHTIRYKQVVYTVCADGLDVMIHTKML
ncbi:MAG: hypothetical protein U9P49_09630 [Thermodesulfobacteriota bacterium]|nr:hypothetical protein [Thermodesulfobacteriota bacterium]